MISKNLSRIHSEIYFNFTKKSLGNLAHIASEIFSRVFPEIHLGIFFRQKLVQVFLEKITGFVLQFLQKNRYLFRKFNKYFRKGSQGVFFSGISWKICFLQKFILALQYYIYLGFLQNFLHFFQSLFKSFFSAIL